MIKRALAVLGVTAIGLATSVAAAPASFATGTCASIPQITAVNSNGTYAGAPATLTVTFFDPDQCVLALNAQFFNPAGEVIGTSNATVVYEGQTTKAVSGWTAASGANKVILTGTHAYRSLFCPIQLSQPCYYVERQRDVTFPVVTIGTFENAPAPVAPTPPVPTKVCVGEPGSKAKCAKGNKWSSVHCWDSARTVTAKVVGGAVAATDTPARSTACPSSKPYQSAVVVKEPRAGNFKYVISNGASSYGLHVQAS